MNAKQMQSLFTPRKSKREIASDLKISRRTIYNIHEMAMEYIVDFRLAYPRLHSELITRAGMDAYQIWVLKMLWEMLSRGISWKHLQAELANNFDFAEGFSKTNYEELTKDECTTVSEATPITGSTT